MVFSILRSLTSLTSLFILVVACHSPVPKKNPSSTTISIPSNDDPNNNNFPVDTDTNPIRVLSLDGGGVRSLVSLDLLQGLFENNEQAPSRFFDIVVGTGSGGLIALSLITDHDGQPRKAKEVFDLFQNNLADLFDPVIPEVQPGQPKPSRSAIIKEAKKKMLRLLFGEKLFKDAVKATILPTINIDDDRPFIFESLNDRFNQLKMREVADLSFDLEISSRKNLSLKNEDGIMTNYYLSPGERYKNNPSLLGIQKAYSLFGADEVNKRGILLISLGTGDLVSENLGKSLANAGDLTWASYIENLLIDGSSSEDDIIIRSMLKDLPDSIYLRIQPQINVDKYANIESRKNVKSANIDLLLKIAANTKMQDAFKLAKESLKKPPARKIPTQIEDDLPFAELTNDPIKILSMDGGGIRGIMTARLLEDIEQIANKKAHQIFDVIAGSSTGGILALGLCTPTDDNSGPVMSAKDLTELYRFKGKQIFTKKSGFWPGPTYTASGLENVVRGVVKNKLFKDLLTETIITTFDLDRRRGYLLASDDKTLQNIDLVQIARATSAAPTYFPAPVLRFKDEQGFDEHYMADGGLWKNNPSLLAYVKAKEKFGMTQLKKRGVIILSIGTGSFLAKQNFGMLAGSTKASVNTAIDISSYEDDVVLNTIIKEIPHSMVIRIQPILDNQRYRKFEEMDDTSSENIRNLLQVADETKNTPLYKKALEIFKAQ